MTRLDVPKLLAWISASLFALMTWAAIVLGILALVGCTQSQTREQTAVEKTDRIVVQGTITIPTADGPRAIPVAVTIDRQGTEDQRRNSDTRTGLDGAAIGREIAAGLLPVLQTATGRGLSWSQMLGGGAAVLTAATTGYLALKKREQMRPQSRRDGQS